MPSSNQQDARNFLDSEYKVNVLERIKYVEKQAQAGAKEEAPVLLGREAFIKYQGAQSAYDEALRLYKRNDNTVSSKLLASYASSVAGKERRFNIHKNLFSNPTAIAISLTIIALAVMIPVSIFVPNLSINTAGVIGSLAWPLSFIPLTLRENYKVKESANQAKVKSLSLYPNQPIVKESTKIISNNIDQNKSNWVERTKENTDSKQAPQIPI